MKENDDWIKIRRMNGETICRVSDVLWLSQTVGSGPHHEGYWIGFSYGEAHQIEKDKYERLAKLLVEQEANQPSDDEESSEDV